MDNVAEEILQIIKGLGISQKKAAELIGITEQTLSKIVNNKSKITQKRVKFGIDKFIESHKEVILDERGGMFKEKNEEMTQGLKDLFEDETTMLMLNMSEEEKKMLQDGRFRGLKNPSKEFYIDQLLAIRKEIERNK